MLLRGWGHHSPQFRPKSAQAQPPLCLSVHHHSSQVLAQTQQFSLQCSLSNFQCMPVARFSSQRLTAALLRCRWQHKGKKKKQSDKEDLYALLGLANERWTANDNQIKLGQSRHQFCQKTHVLTQSMPPSGQAIQHGFACTIRVCITVVTMAALPMIPSLAVSCRPAAMMHTSSWVSPAPALLSCKLCLSIFCHIGLVDSIDSKDWDIAICIFSRPKPCQEHMLAAQPGQC